MSASSPYVTVPHYNEKGFCVFHHSKVRYVHTDDDGDSKISIYVDDANNLVTYTKLTPQEVLTLIDAARRYELEEKAAFK